MVFYLKYRPQKIDELDSKRVRDALFQILSLPQIPHAFLFTGPKGLGKTSAARIVAKAVNCEKKLEAKNQKSKTQLTNKKLEEGSTNDHELMAKDLIEPCNECTQCKSITKGTNLDILEIDAASNRGIDEIRDLREKIKLSPVLARMKVYIIDEVHMLTTEAFNALLKILEEPPSHAMFILCTTELAKVPDTIQSRSFQIKFITASSSDIARSFKRIMDSEKIEITNEAISEITKLADGGFRDAHKILEELVATGDKKITLELIEKKYKVVSSKNQVVRMLEVLEGKDVKSGLEIIQKIANEGMDIKRFTQDLIEAVHEILLTSAGVDQNSEFRIQNSGLETGKWELQELKELLMLLSKALQDMKYSVLLQLPLELAVIDFCRVELLTAKSEKKEDDIIASSINADQKNTTITVTAMRKQVGDIARVKALYGEKNEEKPEKLSVKVTDFSLLNISNEEITEDWKMNFWQVYIHDIKQYNHTIAGVLRSCHINQLDKEKLIIGTAYKFHKERLSDGKTLGILESVCKTLTGKSMTVEVILNNK